MVMIGKDVMNLPVVMLANHPAIKLGHPQTVRAGRAAIVCPLNIAMTATRCGIGTKTICRARRYRWMCYARGNCFLVADRTGVIRDARWRDDRDRRWRQHYSRTYSYEDDIYYRECRSRPDPAGILIGGLIGGLIGHAVGDERAGATFAGIIIGGALGGALTRDMDCDDRSYAYYAYYHGLNRGYPGIYRWRNPHNNHHGDFHVRGYYYDAYGFNCANYRHVVYLDRRREANGRACRQPDGAWAFLD
jgi:surface antigen